MCSALSALTSAQASTQAGGFVLLFVRGLLGFGAEATVFFGFACSVFLRGKCAKSLRTLCCDQPSMSANFF
jgi:hypothetical protein